MTGKPSLKCLMAFLCLLLFNCTYLIAQERIVTGKVKDPQGNPLPGVNVNVWGTRISVTADVTGSFRLPVASENSVLVFSFVGFLQKEVKVGTDSVFNVAMAFDNADLDQVVVVGYGTSKRRDLTGAVYSVKPGMVTGTPTYNAAEALEGRIPGLDITRTNGSAGGGVTIQLRGNRTFNGTSNGVTGSSSAPLVVIDGFQGGSIADLNPNDIESIEVLKDASSTAIYGWMGANGVIIVTTKRGKDRPKVSYNGFYGQNGYVSYPKLRMGDDYVNFRREAYRAANNGNFPASNDVVFDSYELPYYQAGKWVDWLDLMNRNGVQQSHTISLQSGTDKSKVFFSAGYYSEQGMLRGNDMKRYNMRLNYDQRISNTFKAGLMTQLTWTNTNNRKTDPIGVANSLVPLGDAFDSVGNINFQPIKGVVKASPLTDERPGAATDNILRGNIVANGYLEVTPITGLSFRTNVGTTIAFAREGQFKDSLTLSYFGTSGGNFAQIDNSLSRFFNWDNILTYNKKFDDHSLTLTAISSTTRQEDETSTAGGRRMALGTYSFYYLDATEKTATRLVQSSYARTTTQSFAGRLNYTYKGKYLLTATIRTDGVSRLAPGHQWDYFPSAGLGWNIDQEDFMSGQDFVTNLKLRATYGVAGNASVQPYGTQTLLFLYGLNFGNNNVDQTSFVNSTIGNDNLGWEKSATANVGLDFAFLKSRIFGTLDLYKTKTTDILMKRPLPPSSGVTNFWQNVGASENNGIELALSSVNVAQRDMRWTTTLTFTAANEKITKLLYDKDIINGETNSMLIGHPVNSYYSYKKLGIWQTDDKDLGKYKFGSHAYEAGDIKVQDLNGDSIIDATNDKTFVGGNVPKWFAGLQNTFTYKGFELSVYVLARWGQTINADFIATGYNVGGTGNGIASFNYWTPENPSNDFPRPRQGQTYNYAGYTGYLSMNYIDGSYIKLKTLTLAYTLPMQISRKAFAEKIRLYVTGNNVFTKTKNPILKNYDPERGGAISQPITRQFVFGANLDF